MSVLEMWREEHISQNCYNDFTGKSHSGFIVHEQVIVTETGETYDVDDGYHFHKDLGKIYETSDGRRFGIHPETIDYVGGAHIKKFYNTSDEKGHWIIPRSKYNLFGRVYPNRTGPIKPLLSSTIHYT